MTLPEPSYTPADLSSLKGHQLPRIGTPRRPELATYGPAACALWELLGDELFPWQRHALTVGMEIEANGRWRSPTVADVVSRQNGKTRGILLPRIAAQLYLFGGLTLHSAADRAVPREHFEELAELITGVPELSREIKRLRLANGQEEIRLKSGASYRILAPTAKAFRGWTAALLVWDELREQRSREVWSAALYTQRMVPNPQLWTVSNAGDPESVILNDVRDRGRAAAADPDHDRTITYMEWSAAPDREISDPRGWEEANPSLGLGLRPEAFVEEMLNDDPDNFRTEALCIWIDHALQLAVPPEKWEACAAGIPEREDGVRPWLAVDVDPEQMRAVIVAVAWHSGRLVAEVIEQWDGAPVNEELVAARALEWFRALRARSIGFDPYTTQGVADKMAPKLTKRQLSKITATDYYTSCRQLWEAVSNEVLWHPGDELLTGDVLGAVRKEVGDGSWMMSRRHSSRSIPAATALARAVHLAVTPRPTPRVG